MNSTFVTPFGKRKSAIYGAACSRYASPALVELLSNNNCIGRWVLKGKNKGNGDNLRPFRNAVHVTSSCVDNFVCYDWVKRCVFIISIPTHTYFDTGRGWQMACSNSKLSRHIAARKKAQFFILIDLSKLLTGQFILPLHLCGNKCDGF